MEIELNLKVLKAMLIVAGKDDPRKYLNAVAIKKGFMVATDGHRVLRYKLDIDHEITIIMPREAIKALINTAKIFKYGGFDRLILEPALDKSEFSVKMKDRNGDLVFQSTFKSLDPINYPDAEKVYNETNKDESKINPSTLNAKYLADCKKILKAIRNNFFNIRIISNGMSATYIELESKSTRIKLEMLLMPMTI